MGAGGAGALAGLEAGAATDPAELAEARDDLGKPNGAFGEVGEKDDELRLHGPDDFRFRCRLSVATDPRLARVRCKPKRGAPALPPARKLRAVFTSGNFTSIRPRIEYTGIRLAVSRMRKRPSL